MAALYLIHNITQATAGKMMCLADMTLPGKILDGNKAASFDQPDIWEKL